jgi:hypothetical protein
MILMPCPFLKQPVRMSREREEHILSGHRQLVPRWPLFVQLVVEDPDEIRWSTKRYGTLVFGRWYPELLHGKYVLVVVVLDATGRQDPWIVTAYVARHLPEGAVAWRRS